MKNSSDQGKATLRALPGYTKLYQQFKRAIEEAKFEEINQVTHINNEWFAIKRYPTQENPVLYSSDSKGHEKLVSDPEKDYAYLNSKNIVLRYISSSVHGRYRRYSIV